MKYDVLPRTGSPENKAKEEKIGRGKKQKQTANSFVKIWEPEKGKRRKNRNLLGARTACFRVVVSFVVDVAISPHVLSDVPYHITGHLMPASRLLLF